MYGPATWGAESPPPLTKEKPEFDLTHLLDLQSQYRIFKTYLALHPIKTKAAPDRILMKDRSVYKITEIKNHWTTEDQKKEKGEVIEAKLNLFAIYDPSKFPVANPGTANKGNDNVENLIRMTAELEKFMKEELERLANTAVEIFNETFLECTRCMTPTITSMFVGLHLEMRQAIPIGVTRWMVDNWLKTFDMIHFAYQRECAEGGGACDKIVEVNRDLKETWVCIFLYLLPLLEVMVHSFSRKCNADFNVG
jgi:hypothetical protein